MPMSPEERQMLTQLFERVRSQAGAPREQDAEALIADAVRAQPYAPYLLAQAVLVQEQALKGADQRIRELESRLAQAEQAAQAAQEQPRGGGFLGGLFGGAGAPAARQAPPSPWGQANQPAPPPPQGGPWGQQAPQQPGPWGGAPQAQGGGNSFLKGALGAAAGVAGGVLLADTLKGVFGGGHGGGAGGLGAGGFGNAGLGGGETIVNNYYGDDQQRGGGNDPDPGYQDADYQDDGYSGDDSYDA